jgi:hypothetical protein
MNVNTRRVVSIAVAVLVASSAFAAERELFPEDFPGIPAYARLETADETGFTDLEWVVIPFYRDPAGVPRKFNMLDLMDNATPENRAYAWSVPLQVEGFVIRDEPRPSLPKVFYAEGLPGMPVWFVRWEEFSESAADGTLTIREILRMDSLVFGIADFYMEEIQSGLGDNASHRIVTSGILEDGSLFWAHYAHGSASNVPGVQVDIQFK